MNLGLFNKRYLTGGQYTIADMICFPGASSWANRKSTSTSSRMSSAGLQKSASGPPCQEGDGDGAGVSRGSGEHYHLSDVYLDRFNYPGLIGTPPDWHRMEGYSELTRVKATRHLPVPNLISGALAGCRC